MLAAVAGAAGAAANSGFAFATFGTAVDSTEAAAVAPAFAERHAVQHLPRQLVRRFETDSAAVHQITKGIP